MSEDFHIKNILKRLEEKELDAMLDEMSKEGEDK